MNKNKINQLYEKLATEFVHFVAAVCGEIFCIFLLLKCIDLGFNTNIAHIPEITSIFVIIFISRIIRFSIKYAEHCSSKMNMLSRTIERMKKI